MPDGGPDGRLHRGRRRRRRVGVLFAVALFVLCLDAVTKAVVVATLPHHPPIRLLAGLLTLRLIRNGGAAFGIGTSMTIVFTVIAIGVIGYILRTARRLRSLPWAIALGLLLGGAAGNLADRIFRSPGPLQGHVVDWIELPHWPVFNLADAAICCGGALLVLLAGRGVRLDGGGDGHDLDGGGDGHHLDGGADGDDRGRADRGLDEPDRARSTLAGRDDEPRSTLRARSRGPGR